MKLLVAILLLLQLNALAQSTPDSVALQTATGLLQGTLYVPAGKKSFPVLVVIAGSGPTDRNGNNPLGVNANSYKLMAEALGEKKIGVLLYDKRGIAQSRSAGKVEADLRFDDYVNDAVQWVQWLQKDKRVKGIFIAGHSEGSLIGMLAAQQTKLAGYISIAGPARGIAEIITEQYAQQLPKAAKVVDSLFNRMKNKQKLDTVLPYLMSIFRPSVQPYMQSWMRYIPCEELKKLTSPTLIVQGGTDIQVAPTEAALLQQCKPIAQLVMLDSMNHILKNAPKNRSENVATYANPILPLANGFIDALVKFILKFQ